MSDSGNVVKLIDMGAIEAEAAAWIARLDSETATADDQDEFAAWKARNAYHREAAERLAGLWSDLDVLGQLAAPVAPGPFALPGRARAFRTGWAPRPFGLAAAAAAVVAAVCLALMAPQVLWPQTQVYETAVGEQRTVNLADGSSAQLNTNSRIEVRYSHKARDLRLVKGEAFFEVAPNKRRPFSVYARNGVVRAVGTAFSVYLRRDRLEVTVTKGTVQLASFTKPAGAMRLDQAGSLPRRPLAMVHATEGAAESAVLAQGTVEQIVLPAPVVTRRMAWRQGMLAFEGQPLSEVVADVSRYTDMEIEIADPRLRAVRVGGYFKVGEIEPLFEALEASFGVRVERLDATHVRLSAAS